VNPPLYLDTGEKIVGLLSKPKIQFDSPTTLRSNYLIVIVRAMSGAASEKAPQTNTTILGNAFTYRMIVESFPYVPFDANSTNYGAVTNIPAEMEVRANQWRFVEGMKAESHDLRLLFRWPVLPNRSVGNGRQTFRTFIGGRPTHTNYVGDPNPDHKLYFFEPSRYGAREDQS
jgi:hypothetical protein